MPVAVIALLLLPLGLEGFAFAVMGRGIGFILAVSEYISNLEGNLVLLKSAPQAILGLLVIGGLLLLLW